MKTTQFGIVLGLLFFFLLGCGVEFTQDLVDAGEDGGSDSGIDAGTPDGAALDDADAGHDAGPDAGLDAGSDAGTPDGAAHDSSDAGVDAGGDDPPIDVSFACLDTAQEIQVVSGHHEDQFDPDTAPNKAFDARGADFHIHQVRWGMIQVHGSSGDTGMCFAGGYLKSNKPWDASWDDHKDLDGPTRNSAAINNRSTDMLVTGVHYFNVHDGDRTSDAVNWLVQHNWGDYVRDDCIENDHLHSGRVFDTLFDGCYTGISTRPSSSDGDSDGQGELVELDQVLLRMQAMPYPYKWETKPGIIDENGEPYSGSGIPYGHGNLFKMTDESRNPEFSIKNSVFLAVHFTTDEKFDFPPESLVQACQNNTIIWLGPGDYPGRLPTSKFPDCFTILTGQAGRDFWREKVTDWHTRHPGVGAHRKPDQPGSLEYPEVF